MSPRRRHTPVPRLLLRSLLSFLRFPSRLPRLPRLLGTVACLALLSLSACAGSPGPSGVQIEWVNVIQFGGIQYIASTVPVGRAPKDADVGPVFATVQFKLADNVHDPSYHLKDGDAAYLDAGTPVYSVVGYAPTFRLVARWTERLTFYEAIENPQAQTGGELLDIGGGKVVAIGINADEGRGTTQVAAITEVREVERLVALVRTAPVVRDDQQPPPAGQRYFLVLQFRDGTALARAYWPAVGLFSSLRLPQPFQEAIQQALAAASTPVPSS